MLLGVRGVWMHFREVIDSCGFHDFGVIKGVCLPGKEEINVNMCL